MQVRVSGISGEILFQLTCNLSKYLIAIFTYSASRRWRYVFSLPSLMNCIPFVDAGPQSSATAIYLRTVVLKRVSSSSSFQTDSTKMLSCATSRKKYVQRSKTVRNLKGRMKCFYNLSRDQHTGSSLQVLELFDTVCVGFSR